MSQRKYCYKCRRALTPENVVVRYGRRHCKACLLAYQRPPTPPLPANQRHDLPSERWLPVPGYEGRYEVSDLGRVWSCLRPKVRGMILKTFASGPNEYAAVKLYGGSKASARTWTVHVLVATVFCEGRKSGLEVRHWDGNKDNNAASNLFWDTHRVNQLDMIRHGTHLNARKTHCIHGHEFTPENTYWRTDGGRACRRCAADRTAAYQARKQAAHTV